MPGMRGIIEGLKGRYLVRPRGKVLLVLSGIVVFAALFGSYKVYHYTANDQNFCRSCHTMEKAWSLWNTSGHSKVTCHECHSQSFVANGRLLVKYVTKHPQDVETHASIQARVCEKCHLSGDQKWIQVRNSTGHKVHHEREKIDCATCHGAIHRFQPLVERRKTCERCHIDRMEHNPGIFCGNCHVFKGSKIEG